MKLYYLFLLSSLSILLCSCDRERFLICSEDTNQCITVVTYKRENVRYIIPGKHYNVPDENYVKMNIRQIDALGDGIWGCWFKNEGWEMVVEKANIVENKLDSSKFRFKNRLPKDDWGIPRETKFKGENCFVFDFLSKDIEGNSTVR